MTNKALKAARELIRKWEGRDELYSAKNRPALTSDEEYAVIYYRRREASLLPEPDRETALAELAGWIQPKMRSKAKAVST